MLPSELTCIQDGGLYFRGQSALALAESASLEEVAALLWGGLPEAPAPRLPGLARRAADLPPIERFQVALAAVAAQDLRAYDRSADTVRRCGLDILRLLAASAADGTPRAQPVRQVLQEGWAPDRPEAAELIEAALVLWADHELNVGTFTVRCVASAHATPYAAVIAGLSALRGTLHGGLSEQVEALFEEVGTPERARGVLQARLRRGERIPGFGHALYPDGDPRARAVLSRLDARLRADDPSLQLSRSISQETLALIGRAPNVDFSTVTLRRALSLPAGSALALTAVGRSVGWVAHVLEQYAADRLIRPRARYVGPAISAD